MKRLLLLAVAPLLAAGLFGQEFKVGSKVSDFALYDLKGNPVQFSSLKGDVTAIVFVATQCPVSNAYNDRMKGVYNDYASKGVKFVFINSNHTEPAEEVAQHAASHSFPFKVFKDKNNAVADRFGAQVTPETFVVDKAGTIRYHGFIDDSQNPANIKYQGLRKALDAVRGASVVEKAETKAFGCTIKRAKAS